MVVAGSIEYDSKENGLGIGNKLFVIAAAIAVAEDNNDYVRLPEWRYADCFQNKIPTGSIHIDNVWNEPIRLNYIPIKYKKNLKLNGFFQSEKYFKHHEALIRHFLEPNIAIIDEIHNKFNINDKSVSIHVRRGDYVTRHSNHHPPCTMEYFNKSIDQFSDDTKYIICSNDIEWCKENFIGDQFTFSGQSNVIDLFLMSFCKHNIISNSTFSWWGAWLNSNPSKVVIAPTIWFGPGYKHINTDDIIPKEWLRL